MIDTVPSPAPQPFATQLRTLTEMESRYQPKLTGLRVIESATDNGLRMTVRLREYEVKDLLSLTRFFGFSAETFSLSVSLLDRFLSVMKIQPKHLSCVGLCCFFIAIKSTEEEKNVPNVADMIRISQSRFRVSDMVRMERIILEKLQWRVKGPTALLFLRLFHNHVQKQLASDSHEVLKLERLEALLKACHCSFVFSKVKPSLLALTLLVLDLHDEHDSEHVHKLVEAVQSLQQLLNVRDGDLVCVRELVAKCVVEYSTTRRSRPSCQNLRWVISGRTARQLKHSYYRISHLPTIPESGC